MLLWFLDALVCVLPQSCSGTNCDIITSRMRGLSPKIISGDPRWSENTQTQHMKYTIPSMKFKLKLLHIKCHVLEFTKDESQKIASKDNSKFLWKWFIPHSQAHTLHPRRECLSLDDLHIWVLVGNPILIDLDLPLTTLIGVTRRRKKILTCTHTRYSKSKAWAITLRKLIRHDLKATKLDMQMLQK
jgi:hypothetical protein